MEGLAVVNEDPQPEGVTTNDPLHDEFHRTLQEEFDEMIQSTPDQDCWDDHEDEEDDCENGNGGGEQDQIQVGQQQVEESTTAATGMWLSEQERECALLIKKAIEEQPELDNLNDYWYAHLAIFELKQQLPDNNNRVNINFNLLVEGTLQRVHALQVFKQDQKIVETLPNAKRVVQNCTVKYFPGWMLGLSYSPSDGGYTMVHDVTKIYMDVLNRDPAAIDAYLQFVYFLFQATSHDFASCRTGLYSIAECEGQDFSKNFGLNFMRQLWTEIGTVYPMQFQKIEMVHSGFVPALLWNMSKRFLPQRFKVKGMLDFVSGTDVERLDKLYLIPNLEFANERLASTLMDGLQKRYHNEATFRL